MAETRHDEAFDVVSDAIVAALDKRRRLSTPEQSESPAGTDAELKRIVVACRFDDLEQVIEQGVVDPDLLDNPLQFDHVRTRHYRANRGERVDPGTVPQNAAFVVLARISHMQPEHEPVKL